MRRNLAWLSAAAAIVLSASAAWAAGTFRPNTANVPSKAPGAQPGDPQR